MKTKYLFPFLVVPLLASCGECKHLDENKDHVCDLCNTKISEHVDENKDHVCDYCLSVFSQCFDGNFDGFCDYCDKEMPIEEGCVEWPEKDIQDLVEEVADSKVIIPHFKRADEIEINTDELLTSGYFGIWCYTENDKCEIEYKAILTRAGWEVEPEKDENGFYWAYDPNYEVCINFGFFANYSDLEIYVTECTKTKWPARDIRDALNKIAPGSKTTIPEFEAYAVQANYYEQYRVLAINATGYADNIIDTYSNILKTANWTVSFDDTIDEYIAISPDKDIKLQFYIEDDKQLFNVDVFSYTPPVQNWPYEQIAAAVESIGATGEILPYLGTFTGVTVDLDWGDPAIIVDVQAGTEVTSANAYNQMLVSKGYVIADEQYLFEDIYVLPGTDLGCRGVYLNNGHNFTIEMCKLSKIAE